MADPRRIFSMDELVKEQWAPHAGQPAVGHSRLGAARVDVLASASGIARHIHTDDEEAVFIVEGRGIYVDNEGKAHKVKAGDAAFCLKGEGHALFNPGPSLLICFMLTAL